MTKAKRINIYVLQVSALKKIRYGRSHKYFILFQYFICISDFEPYFPSFFTILDYLLNMLHNEMFRVRKPETHIIVFCLSVKRFS